MKIGILGGSFDPPHLGHYLVIKQILEIRKDINKILLVPAFKHQWKPIQASVKDRLAMLQSLVNEKTEISDTELQRQGVSYTVDTVREIKNKTKADIFWIVGSDILSEFHRWEKTEELLNLATFLVFPRDPHLIPGTIPAGFEVIQNKNLITTSISSTAIRQRVKEGKSISYLVPKEVEKYIAKHNLYQ
ncbi:MAG: nicotinate (nicotinamide) nucleotide adenylyltransferase [Candidatus Levybacteria bacterium]|nr:nicotinate (nicotinamide) nucleotide adenylyltransferase [Candidatus Levybacteria bacterium]